MNNIQFVFPTKEESHKAIHKKIMWFLLCRNDKKITKNLVFPITHSHLVSLSDTPFVFPTKEESHKAIHKKIMWFLLCRNDKKNNKNRVSPLTLPHLVSLSFWKSRSFGRGEDFFSHKHPINQIKHYIYKIQIHCSAQ